MTSNIPDIVQEAVGSHPSIKAVTLVESRARGALGSEVERVIAQVESR